MFIWRLHLNFLHDIIAAAFAAGVVYCVNDQNHRRRTLNFNKKAAGSRRPSALPCSAIFAVNSKP